MLDQGLMLDNAGQRTKNNQARKHQTEASQENPGHRRFFARTSGCVCGRDDGLIIKINSWVVLGHAFLVCNYELSAFVWMSTVSVCFLSKRPA